MNFKHFIIIFLCVFLTACGGQSSNEDELNKDATVSDTVPDTPEENSGLAPDSISRTIFEMVIDVFPTEELGNNFPTIGSKIIQEFSQNAVYYLQSDQYDGLEYYGKYNYQGNGDEADISLKLTSSNTVYTIHYQFTDVSAGIWQGTFNNGLSEFSGTFTTKAAPNLNGSNFQKTVFIEEQDIHSSITGITYQYNVYLPQTYDNTSKDYPVIYVTDAQWGADERFAHIIETKQKDIIVVGITQGPVGQRTTDFLWPGSSHYLEFFSNEFLPLIESQYRIDTSNRTLYGHSYGGVLIRHALINEVSTPLFQNFISSDGSFMVENTTYLRLEADSYEKNSLVNRKLFLAGGKQANGPFVSGFYDTIRGYDLEDFIVYHQSFDLGHNQVVLPGIRGAMDSLFP